MGKEHTDLKVLAKGIKFMAGALPLLFLSPYLITMAFLNKDSFWLYVFFVFGLIAGIAAIYLLFKGLRTIINSIF